MSCVILHTLGSIYVCVASCLSQLVFCEQPSKNIMTRKQPLWCTAHRWTTTWHWLWANKWWQTAISNSHFTSSQWSTTWHWSRTNEWWPDIDCERKSDIDCTPMNGDLTLIASLGVVMMTGMSVSTFYCTEMVEVVMMTMMITMMTENAWFADEFEFG